MEIVQVDDLSPAPESPRAGSLFWRIFVIVAALMSLLFYGMRDGKRDSAVESDRNGDGKTDARQEIDSKGRATLAFEDNNHDGRWDVRYEFLNGIPVRGERDLDFDGNFDAKMDFANGVIVTETVRTPGSPHPLFRHEYRHGVLQATWSDPDLDGAWNERIEYDALGLETGRIPLR
jgi:hypothetical protein